MMNFKPEMHEEIEMIASKLLNKIPVKKASESASQTKLNQPELESDKEVSIESDQPPDSKASPQKEESHAESITPVDKQNSSVLSEAKQNEEEKVTNCQPKDVPLSASTNFVYKTRRSLRRSHLLGTTSAQSLVEQPTIKDININNT